jgi:hypothetical protein
MLHSGVFVGRQYAAFGGITQESEPAVPRNRIL